MAVTEQDHAALKARLEELGSELGAGVATLSQRSSAIARSFSRLSKHASGSLRTHYLARSTEFEARAASSQHVAELLVGTAKRTRGERPPAAVETTPASASPFAAALMVEDVVDPSSPPVQRAAAVARALVTARGFDDLGEYIELLDEVKDELALARERKSQEDVQFLLGLVGSLSLIGAVLVRSAERSGLTTESGQPLLAELFQRLVATGANL